MALKTIAAAPPRTVGLRGVPIATFLITVFVLGMAEWKTADLTMLLFERFWPGTAWLEVLLLAAYAAWLARAMLDPKRQPILRRRVWLIFSLVFFAQLSLGLIGRLGGESLATLETFLMTGKLHVPVPAVIIGGPLFRGGGLFMAILFVSTVVLVGPTWCSHLCYFGAFDGQAAAVRRKPKRLPDWVTPLRVALLVAVPVVALSLRAAGVSGLTASLVGVGFGVAGIVVMLAVSRRLGTMAHCIVWCPLGLLAVLLGKISPFRVRIGPECDECQACTRSCRYGALFSEHIENRKAGFNCTLCGDCVKACPKTEIGYRFFRLSPAKARAVFLSLAVALHAACLGVARI